MRNTTMSERTPAPNIVDVVRRESADPDRPAYSFMGNTRSGIVDDALTYGRLDLEARRVAVWLAGRGVSSGDRVLLLFPAGLGFLKAFMGCLYAGAVAVPAPLPDRFTASIGRTAGILHDAQVTAVLSDSGNAPFVTEWLSGHGCAVPCGAVDDLPGDPAEWRRPDLAGDSLAFLQYTSGSTSDPKGVMVSHGNLMDNLLSISRCVGIDEGFRQVGWLPAVHDMGLIGQLLLTAFLGGELLLLPPSGFLRRPHHWLQLIDWFGANYAGAPNFAYDLCLQKVTDEQIAGLDLSRWRVAFNGAEPIRDRTLSAFAERFAPAGFQASAFRPCYGLAEAALMVTATGHRTPMTTRADVDAFEAGRLRTPDEGARQRTLVSSGRAEGCEIRIVEPATAQPLGDGRVGEIWVRGTSVARGYWRRRDCTDETFGAVTTSGDDGFLRTGDLGVLRDGELYVTGRLKDLIVVRGRNLYPQDLEAAAGDSVTAGATGASAVFGLSDTGDDIVVVQEVKPPALRASGAAQELSVSIRTALVAEFGIRPPSVVLVKPGAVRKTTSGKIRRSLMRQLFLQADLDPFHEDLTDTTQQLRQPTGRNT
jgi:acyl-CoA synthetase (AMP-forming)/AMP-acid ligase II